MHFNLFQIIKQILRKRNSKPDLFPPISAPKDSLPSNGLAATGDFDKTRQVIGLLNIPSQSRNAKWERTFFSIVHDAVFALGEPEMMNGPDRFPYLNLVTPTGRVGEIVSTLRILAPSLIERCCGATINAHPESVDWVFSAGDMVSLQFSGSIAHPTPKAYGQHVVKKETQVMIGAPSEKVFPKTHRKNVRLMLEQLGHQNVGVLNMLNPSLNPPSSMVFSINPDRFKNDQEREAMMTLISWFLPRDYPPTLISSPENLGPFTFL